MAPVTANGETLVLLDTPGGEGGFDQSMLERMGHRVVVCGGPRRDQLCPLLGGQGCPLFEQAHGIVMELDLDRVQHRLILRAYRDKGGPELPIRVIADPVQQVNYAYELRDIEVWDHSPTAADLDGFASEVDAADRFRD